MADVTYGARPRYVLWYWPRGQALPIRIAWPMIWEDLLAYLARMRRVNRIQLDGGYVVSRWGPGAVVRQSRRQAQGRPGVWSLEQG